MATYTVHEPTSGTGVTHAHTDRFVFVRDGFSWPAFLFGPFWMLRHRLWLALLGYLVIAAALGALLRSYGATGTTVLVALLLGMLIGIEASTLRRWGLERRRWTGVGVVVADDLESAERRFFDAWIARQGGRRIGRSPASSALAPGRPEPEVIGLFPDSGARS